MKKLMISALITGQSLIAAQPATAAELVSDEARALGAFGGVTLRVPLDGEAGERPMRVALTLAPTSRTQTVRGESRTRIGEGLELGFAGDERARLSIAGTPVSRLAQGPAAPEGQRAGLSPLGWVAIGAGIIAVGTIIWFVNALNDDDRCCE